ncbi:MAG: hypothetical protein WDZ40_00690 [Candidatus Spechtbacterales bacterium]
MRRRIMLHTFFVFCGFIAMLMGLSRDNSFGIIIGLLAVVINAIVVFVTYVDYTEKQ